MNSFEVGPQDERLASTQAGEVPGDEELFANIAQQFQDVQEHYERRLNHIGRIAAHVSMEEWVTMSPQSRIAFTVLGVELHNLRVHEGTTKQDWILPPIQFHT